MAASKEVQIKRIGNKKGEIKIVLNEKEEFFKIEGWVIEVSQNKVIVLVS